MTAVRPLRRLLFIRFVLVAVAPILLAALIGLAWFLPRLRSDVGRRQAVVATAFADEIDIYIRKARLTAGAIAALPAADFSDPALLRHALDAQAQRSAAVRCIYLTDAAGRIAAIGLKQEDVPRRPDLLGLDVSGTPLWGTLQRSGQPDWSDLYLSLVGGGLTVAVAEPLANGGMVVAEVDLANLSGFLGSIARGSEQTVLILDRRGQLIADQSGRFTAQQYSLRHIPFIGEKVASDTTGFGELTYEGVKMIGNLQQVPGVRWHVLVAQPTTVAYRSLHYTFGALGVAFLAALLVGIVVALRVARGLALRFERLTTHARQVAAGDPAGDWPRADVREFEQLGANLQQMADAIRERERQLVTLTNNLPGMVFRCTPDQDGRFLFASKGSHALTGYTAEELVAGRGRLRELAHPDDRAAGWAEVNRRLQQHLPFDLVFRLVTRDGSCKWVWALGQGVESAGRRCVEGFLTDISKRVAAETALREALLTAESASRAKSEFLANMSHELRTPLNGVLGMLQLLERDAGLGGEQREFVRIAATSGWNLLTLLNDILDLSRIEAGRLELHEEPTDVAALAAEVLQIFRPNVAGKGVTLQLTLAEGTVGPVGLDATRVRQILFNLVGNAVKFTEAGSVVLSVGPVRALAGGRGVLQLAVADTGIGMGPEIQERIFAPFAQGEVSFQRRFQGAGLGLSVVRRLVELMHGQVTVASREGEGSIFTALIEVGLPPFADAGEDARPS